MLIAAFVLPLPLVAQDEAPGEGGAAPPVNPPPETAAPANPAPADREPADAAEGRRTTDEVDEFVPTEEAPPDEQVVFLVDI
jgi:hypothetical protein